MRRLVPVDTHIPEQMQLALPAVEAGSPAAAWPVSPPGEPPMRPLHLFDPPQPIEVIAEVPDGPPHRFRWRRAFHEVRRFEGPERIASEWWKRRDGAVDKAGLTRDYYRVEDARGRRFWIFRHGLYEEKPNPQLVSCTGCSHDLRDVRRDWSPRPITASCAAPRIPRDMVGRALELGMAGIGIADRNSVAGVVRAWVALNEACEQAKAALEEIDFKLIVGARLVFADATPDIVAYPATRHGWGRLTRLLTIGNRRAEKGDCILHFADLLAHAEDLLLIVMADEDQEFLLRRLAEARPGAVWLGAVDAAGRQRPATAGQAQATGGTHRRAAARDQRRALRLARQIGRCTTSSPASAKA